MSDDPKELAKILEEVRAIREVFASDMGRLRKRQNAALEKIIGSADTRKIGKIRKFLETLRD